MYKADLDFLAFCVLEETTRTTADDLDEDGAERPRLPYRRSQPGPEPTTLEAVSNQWRYALVVVQAGEEEEEILYQFICSFQCERELALSIRCEYSPRMFAASTRSSVK